MTKRAKLVVTIFVLACVGAFSFAAWSYVSREPEPSFATGKQKPGEFCAAMAANVATAQKLPLASEYIVASPERAQLEEWKSRFMSVNGLDEAAFDSNVRVYSAEDRDATNGEHLGLVVGYAIVHDWYVVTATDYLIADEYTAAHPKSIDEISDLRVVLGAPWTPLTCEAAVTQLAIPDDGTISLQLTADDIRLHGEGEQCLGPLRPQADVVMSLTDLTEIFRTTHSGECAHAL